MNIPQDTLQQVADEAFAQSPSSPLSCVQNGTNWKRQPNIRRAVIQHALDNPALAPFLGGVGKYTDQAIYDAWKKAVEDNDAFPDRMRAFIAALPRRESPALAEATPPAEPEPAVWSDPVCGCIRSPDAPKDSPCPICKPDALVPLGPEDVPPGSALKMPDWEGGAWRIVIETDKEGIWLACVKTGAERISYKNLFVTGVKINTSIPDTGRWDANAWRACSKPAGKEVAK